MISSLYGGSKPSDDEDKHHINRVVVNEDDGDEGLVESVNQYMTPLALEFEIVSADDQYRCNDWVDTFSFTYMS